MTATLLRRFNPLPWLVLLLVALGLALPAQATHLLGGEMTYRYLDANGPSTAPHRYELTTSLYVTCSSAATQTYLDIDIFNKANGAHVNLTSSNIGSSNGSIYGGAFELTQPTISVCTTIAVPPGCPITGASQPYQLQKFVGIVCLPASTTGYYAITAPGGARNAGINNLANGASSGYSLALYSTLAPPVYANHSPVFTGDAVGLICSSDTTVVLNNAVDADGDRLVYTFGQPYTFPNSLTTFSPPLPYVPYTTTGGYSAATPLGTGAGYYANINAGSGITKYVGGPTLGNRYSVAIDVTEYRTISGVEVALGTTRRDIQLIVGSCPPTTAPTLPPVGSVPRAFTIEVGSTLSIPLTGAQPGAHPLTLTATSTLLDGTGGYNATFDGNTGTPTYTGSPVGAYTVVGTTGGTVAGAFVYTPACTEARATPYDVTLTLRDLGCAGKITSDVLRITVVKPTGPTAIAGPLSVCGLNTVQTYTASGGTAPNISWTVTGGTIVGSSTANPVQVRWSTAGTGTLTAQGITQYGCPTDLVTRSVIVSPAAILTVTGNQNICQGGSTTVTVAGGTGPYVVTGGVTPITGAGPFVLSPTQTTTYTITPVVGPANGCPATGQITITVNPLPAANAGSAVTLCPGGTGQLGAAPVAGSTYSWSPATGLSSSTVANPTVTLPNTTGVPITQTYTLTETSTPGGCQASHTVTVTVGPPTVAAAGAATTICSGGIGQLGAASVAGTTYSWSPATGLSSTTVANPTVTLTNTTGAPITQTYTLMASAGANCTSTGTVVVTVNPAPVANAGAPITICPSSAGQLGTAPVAGLTYSWSPATGLSNTSIANPTVTLPNTTGAAITQTYTLTVTSAAGCPGTGTVAVTVSPQLVVNAGAPVSLCSGGSAQLGGAPVAGNTYSWSPATGLSNANIANPTVTLTNTTGAPITQTYTLTVSTAASCASTGTVAVTVGPPPVANAGAPITICPGSAGLLGAAPVAGLTYSWSPAAGLSNASIANPTVTLPNTTGAPITQTYTLTVSTAANCLSIGTVVVTVSPLPVVATGPAVAICSGGSAQLGAASVAGTTYSWSPATGLSSTTAANPTVTLTNTTGAPITQTYTLTVTNAATGCQNAAPVVVTVNPLPVAAAGPAVAICSGGTGQIGAAAVAGIGYSWSPATGLSSSTVANPVVSLTNTTGAPITQTYTLTVTNAATSCVNTNTVVVTVNPLPVAAPGGAITICSGGLGQLGSAPVAGLTYSWSPATGLSSATVANPTVTLTNATTAATTQTYTLTVTSLGTTCAGTGTVAVTVNPAVRGGTIGADQVVCMGAVPAPLTSTAAASGGLGAYDYQWESSPDNVTWKAIANITTLSYAPTAITATTYYRRRVLAGACGLTYAYTNVVTVQAQQLLVPAVALPTLPAQCAGLALTFTPAPTNAGAAPTYRWFVNGTQVATGPTYTSSTVADGDVVQVELTPTVGFCATGTAVAATRVSRTAVPLPKLTLLLKTTLPVCVGAPVSFSLDQATNVGTNPQYQWQVDGVNVSGATATNFTSTTLRDGQSVTLVVRTTDACGQPATATSGAVRVLVNPPVHVSAGPDKTITEGESVTLEGTADGSYPVTWTPSSTLALGTNPLRPVATPAATTTYVLSAGAGYCADQSPVTVTVLRRVRIPNAFTPNADNNDDTWQIANIEEYPGNHVLVFNRWGQKVFEASGYSRSNEWNGTSNGQDLPFATYYYVITLGNGKSFTGPLTVLR
ncbi:MAG: gliding motility-associated C-terminal domain-containing protein [Janthinobacterium lividum]